MFSYTLTGTNWGILQSEEFHKLTRQEWRLTFTVTTHQSVEWQEVECKGWEHHRKRSVEGTGRRAAAVTLFGAQRWLGPWGHRSGPWCGAAWSYAGRRWGLGPWEDWSSDPSRSQERRNPHSRWRTRTRRHSRWSPGSVGGGRQVRLIMLAGVCWFVSLWD